MSNHSANDQEDPDGQAAHVDTDAAADAPFDAMKDQLRDDVTSWRAERSETAARESAELTVPVVKPAPKAAPRARKAAAPAQPVDVKKKPFGMSYDGMSQADYITYMISRGAR
jgi:hypothetical protein